MRYFLQKLLHLTSLEKIIFQAFVIITASSYWLFSYYTHPEAALSEHILYRYGFGDFQYFPFIKNLSQFNLFEFFNTAINSEKLLSFPYGAIFLHSLLYAIAGNLSYVIADLIVFSLFFWVLVTFFRVYSINNFTALLISSTLICFAPSTFLQWTVEFLTQTPYTPNVYFQSLNPLNIWGLRIPRPFVSELYLFGYLILFKKAFFETRRSFKIFSLLGLLLGLNINSNFHISFIFILWTSLYFCFLLKNETLKSFLKLSLSFIVTVLLSTSFFIWVRLQEHPDIPIRLGLFKPDQFLFEIRDYPSIGLWLISNILIYFKRKDQVFKPLMSLSILVFISFISLPILSGIFNKGIQIYQFRMCFVLLSACLFFVTVLQTINHLNYKRKLHPILIFLTFSGSFTSLYTLHNKNINRTKDVRRLHTKTYRISFRELTRYLAQYANVPHSKLGSFDPQIVNWWISFNQNAGSSLVDPFNSSLSNIEIEDNFIAFCKSVGFNWSDVESLLKNKAYNMFWLSHAKYQNSKAHRFSSQGKTPYGSIYKSWSLEVPKTEIERIRLKFHAYKKKSPLPSTLVLLNNNTEMNLNPDLNKYKLEFKNKDFRVFRIHFHTK